LIFIVEFAELAPRADIRGQAIEQRSHHGSFLAEPLKSLDRRNAGNRSKVGGVNGQRVRGRAAQDVYQDLWLQPEEDAAWHVPKIEMRRGDSPVTWLANNGLHGGLPFILERSMSSRIKTDQPRGANRTSPYRRFPYLCDMYVRALHIGTLKLKSKNFR
jgi:hypothetical protein